VILKKTLRKYIAITAALARWGIQGAGYFFHDQMITPVRLNGKGCLPPRSAKAAGSYCFTELVLPAGGKMRGRCRLAAPLPMIGHLVVEKIAPPPE